jgi:3,4-dihydroxy-2-butanone 4-phosphate synthase
MRHNPIASFSSGRPVVLLDDTTSHGAAELLVSAAIIEPITMAFLVRHTSGFVTVALPATRCDELGLPAVVAMPNARYCAVPAVAVDAADGVTTGISASDRAYTARLLAHEAATVDHFTRPGHLVPLRLSTQAQNVPSAPAAALQLARVTWLPLAVVTCHLVRDDGPLLSMAEGYEFAAAHGLAVVTVDEMSASTELVGAA